MKTKHSSNIDEDRISTIYQRCVNALVSIKKYKSDERFIRICICYADRSKRTLKEFESFYKMNIGVCHVMMWMCWAWSAEKYGHYKLANNIFKKALEKKIEPVALVSERFHQFRRRMQLREQKVFDEDDIRDIGSTDENENISRIHLHMSKASSFYKECTNIFKTNTNNKASAIVTQFGKGPKRQKITREHDAVALQNVTNSCLGAKSKRRLVRCSSQFISVYDELGYETCFEIERAKISRLVLRGGNENNFNSLSQGLSKHSEDSMHSYDDVHAHDIQNAIQVLTGSKRCQMTLSNVHLRVDEKLPKCLIKSGKKRASFRLDSSECDAFHKLGSGSNGTVFLCGSKDSRKHNNEGTFALKVQSPVGCLAWEFMVLERLKTRLKDFNLIPYVASISIFADGGAMQMTAGSQTGFTLLDLVNLYKGGVPELLAIHYTHKMLAVIEILHLRGRILHCDIKPDNWIICDNSGLPVDIMLIDFGRAIELTDEILSNGLCGKAAAEDLHCYAMENGQPWCFDIDCYGVCVCSHTLLFGTYIEVIKETTHEKWKLKNPFKRYWQTPLWRLLFDSLMNGTCRNLETYGKSLKSIREVFEAHLALKSDELHQLLLSQKSMLPSNKIHLKHKQNH